MEQLNFDLKYRPKSLEEIVGNRTTVEYLGNLLKGKFPGFTIFTGPPGSGKTTAAFITAMSLLCENQINGKACGMCETCKLLKEELYVKGNTSPVSGLYMFDMGPNTNQEYVNNISRNIGTKSVRGKKIILLEELQSVRKEYQQSLLRTLEFIPEDVHVIVTTSEPYKILDALQSRAIEVRFSYPTTKETTELIRSIAEKENIAIKVNDIKSLISFHEGNPRKILKSLETIKQAGTVGIELITNPKKEERLMIDNFFNSIDKGMEEFVGFIDDLDDKVKFILSLKYFFKDMIKSTYVGIEGISKEEVEIFKRASARFDNDEIYRILEKLTNLPYLSEEDAEVIIILLGQSFSSKIEYEAVNTNPMEIKASVEDVMGKIENITESMKATSGVIDLNEL